MEANRCYTVKDIQDILGISRTGVYELIKRNEFRTIMVCKKYRIPRKGFDAWLNDDSSTKNLTETAVES